MIETGIATLITSVVPILLRKMYRIKTARRIPINKVFFTSPIAVVDICSLVEHLYEFITR